MAQTLIHINTEPIHSYKADGAITKYRAVKLSTADETVAACTDGDAAIGVSLETVADGQTVRVGVFGILPVQCNAAVAKNALVNAAAAGGLVDDAVSAGEVALGRSLRAATAQNDVIPVFVCPYIYATS